MDYSGQHLTKAERLHGFNVVQELFNKGTQAFIHPYKYYWKLMPFEQSSLRFMVSVPKRNFKKAVDRNRIKRLTREAWRRNNLKLKTELISEKLTLNVALVFVGKSLPDFKETEAKIILILQRLSVLHAHHQKSSSDHPDSDY
jgi:ribonuclease P protein component